MPRRLRTWWARVWQKGEGAYLLPSVVAQESGKPVGVEGAAGVLPQPQHPSEMVIVESVSSSGICTPSIKQQESDCIKLWVDKAKLLDDKGKRDKKKIERISKGSLITFSILEGLAISAGIYSVSLPFHAIPGVSIIASVVSFLGGISAATALYKSNVEGVVKEATADIDTILKLNEKRIKAIGDWEKDTKDNKKSLFETLKARELTESKPVIKTRGALVLTALSKVWAPSAATGLSVTGLSFNPLQFISKIFKSTIAIMIPAVCIAAADAGAKVFIEEKKKEYEEIDDKYHLALKMLSNSQKDTEQESEPIQAHRQKIEELKAQIGKTFRLSPLEKSLIMCGGLLSGIATCGIVIAFLSMLGVHPIVSIFVGMLVGVGVGLTYCFALKAGQKKSIDADKKKCEQLRQLNDGLCSSAVSLTPKNGVEKKRGVTLGTSSVSRFLGTLFSIGSLVTDPIIKLVNKICSLGVGVLAGLGVGIPNIAVHTSLEYKNGKCKDLIARLEHEYQCVQILKSGGKEPAELQPIKAKKMIKDSLVDAAKSVKSSALGFFTLPSYDKKSFATERVSREMESGISFRI